MSKSAQNKQSTPPTHFLCPISLEIMKDPVTLCTGQTYERTNIQRWFASGHKTCPITMVKLSNLDLIPNHTLRRLIQDYHLTSSSFGLKKSESPATEMDDEQLRKLVKEMEVEDMVRSCIRTLCTLAEQSVNHRCRIADAGAVRLLISMLQKDQQDNALHQMDVEDSSNHILADVIFLLSCVPLVDEERRAIADPRPLEQVLWFLHYGVQQTKIHAVRLLRKVAVVDDVMMLLGQVDGVLSGLISLIRDESASKQGQKSALKTMFQICLPHCNRVKCVESGAIQAILENLHLARKKNTERGLSVISLLCVCNEGRQALLDHPGSFAVLLQTLHTSAKATEAAITTLWSVVSFNADAAAEQFRSLQSDTDAIFSKLVLLLHGDYSHSTKTSAINLLKMLKTLRGSFRPSSISGLDVLDPPDKSESG